MHACNLCWCSVAKSCLTLYHPMDCSTLGSPPLLFPRVCSNSYPLSQWCYATISSSAAPFSFCLQSFPTSGFFPTSQLFISGGQSVETSVLPVNIQSWFPLGSTGLITLQSKEPLIESCEVFHYTCVIDNSNSTFYFIE